VSGHSTTYLYHNAKEKQRSTNITHKTKDRVTEIRLKSGVNTVAPEE
jgi:hypothetical protein